MKGPSDEDADSQGVDFLPGTGAVSYLYALQGGPTYAVGAGAGDRIKGALYRSSAQSCPVSLLGTLGSRWNSQKVVSGEPCEPFVLPIVISTSIPEPSCLVEPSADPLNCCPEGAELSGDGRNAVCIISEGLVAAESVLNPNDPTSNVLDELQSPFTVNLPIDNDADSWTYTPPRSEIGS